MNRILAVFLVTLLFAGCATKQSREETAKQNTRINFVNVFGSRFMIHRHEPNQIASMFTMRLSGFKRHSVKLRFWLVKERHMKNRQWPRQLFIEREWWAQTPSSCYPKICIQLHLVADLFFEARQWFTKRQNKRDILNFWPSWSGQNNTRKKNRTGKTSHSFIDWWVHETFVHSQLSRCDFFAKGASWKS